MKHTKDSIKQLLVTNDKALVRGLLVIHGLQTRTEQEVGHTNTENGVGFSHAHAEFATSLVNFYRRKGFLSPKQLQAARKVMQRYAGQLAKVANGEIVNPLDAPTPKEPVQEPNDWRSICDRGENDGMTYEEFKAATGYQDPKIEAYLAADEQSERLAIQAEGKLEW